MAENIINLSDVRVLETHLGRKTIRLWIRQLLLRKTAKELNSKTWRLISSIFISRSFDSRQRESKKKKRQRGSKNRVNITLTFHLARHLIVESRFSGPVFLFLQSHSLLEDFQRRARQKQSHYELSLLVCVGSVWVPAVGVTH